VHCEALSLALRRNCCFGCKDTALPPKEAAKETLAIIREIVGQNVNGSRRFQA
jgi:hypothetical protein